MLGLHVDHRERVVDRDAGALVDRQVVVGVRLADREGLPQLALAVVDQRAVDVVDLGIDVEDALADRVRRVHRCGLQHIDLAQLPGDLREAATLPAEVHELVATRILELVGQLQLVVVVVGHQDVLRALERPLHVRDAAVVALEVLDHQVRAEEGVRRLPGGEPAHTALEAQVEVGVVELQVVLVALDQELRVLQVLRLEHRQVDAAEQLRGVGRHLGHRRMLHAVLEVQEVEVELQRALDLAGRHVAVLPVERVDRRVVAPVEAVLEVPRQLLAGTRVVGLGLLREGPAGNEAGDLAVLGAELGGIQVLLRGLDIELVHRELRGRPDLDLVPAVLDDLVEARVQGVLELLDVGLVDHGAGGQAGNAREAALVRVERGLHVGLGGGAGGQGEARRDQGQPDLMNLRCHDACLLLQN